MREYIARRLLLLVPIMLGVSFMTFLAFRIIPGDAATIICGFQCPPDQIEELRHHLGLDRPWYEQYGSWLRDAATGDLGTSFHTKLPVTTELERRLPITAEIVIMTLIFSLLLGIPSGIVSAIRPGTAFDWIARFVSVLWLSIPTFYLGTVLIVFGLLWFNWTPPQFSRTYVPFFDDPWVNLQEFFFPSLILALGSAAFIMRLTRSSMLEVMRNDYIRTAWAKGLRERMVIWRHALKNALIPVVTIIGLEIGGLIGGAVIIESIFALQGIGYYTLEAVLKRDLLVVQALAACFAIVYVSCNLMVDVLYAWLDPRIRYA